MSSGTNELLMIADFNNIKDNVTKTYFLCLCSMREIGTKWHPFVLMTGSFPLSLK